MDILQPIKHDIQIRFGKEKILKISWQDSNIKADYYQAPIV
jgi:hypothetical protein